MLGLFGDSPRRRTKAMRVRKMQAQVAKLEKKKALAAEEKRLKSKLASLRRAK